VPGSINHPDPDGGLSTSGKQAMLSITAAVGLGGGGMREMVVGVIAVGLFLGIVLGRNTERARRSLKDVGTAKANLAKTQATFKTELGRAVVSGLIIAAIVVGVITLAFSDGA
jgi:hypothetical protein